MLQINTIEQAMEYIERLEDEKDRLTSEIIRDANKNVFYNIDILTSHREWYMLGEIAEYALKKSIEVLSKKKTEMHLTTKKGQEFRLKVLTAGSVFFSKVCIDFLKEEGIIDAKLAEQLLYKVK